MNKPMKWPVILFVLVLMLSCGKVIEESGAIVPPTANEDPALPQLTISVRGHNRKLHLQTFGNAGNPPLFVLPGGPGADFRLMLPLKALADSFFVVMWDPRGAGLSERVPKEELSFDSFMEEIAAVKNQLSPNKRVSLVGHSFGALFMTRYASEHPKDVDKLVLIEPGWINHSKGTRDKGGGITFSDGQDFFWSNELLTSSDHAAADYKAINILPLAYRSYTCDNKAVINEPMWRFGAYHYHILTKNDRQLPHDYNWAKGIENFSGRITVITGTCGSNAETYQRENNMADLPGASLQVINGAGHISLFVEYAQPLVRQVRLSLK
jgi:proline iminopeptidase